MKFFLFLIIFSLVSSLSLAATFQNFKTEKEKISDGVILEKQIASSTGKIIKQVYKIKINGNFYEAVKKNGKWQLSDKGKATFEDAQKGGGSSSSGDGSGGGGGC